MLLDKGIKEVYLILVSDKQFLFPYNRNRIKTSKFIKNFKEMLFNGKARSNTRAAGAA